MNTLSTAGSLDRLTSRERQVLALVAEGHSPTSTPMLPDA
jgi:DNA-binding CsgD family transcriptional regulator